MSCNLRLLLRRVYQTKAVLCEITILDEYIQHAFIFQTFEKIQNWKTNTYLLVHYQDNQPLCNEKKEKQQDLWTWQTPANPTFSTSEIRPKVPPEGLLNDKSLLLTRFCPLLAPD